MNFQITSRFTLLITITLVVFSLNLFSRSPAVEPVFGFKPDIQPPTQMNQTNMMKFNFEAAATNVIPEISHESQNALSYSIFIIFAFISLPLVIWSFINKNTENLVANQNEIEKDVSTDSHVSEQEDTSNVASLSEYRNKNQSTVETNKQTDDPDIKKAS